MLLKNNNNKELFYILNQLKILVGKRIVPKLKKHKFINTDFQLSAIKLHEEFVWCYHLLSIKMINVILFRHQLLSFYILNCPRLLFFLINKYLECHYGRFIGIDLLEIRVDYYFREQNKILKKVQ